MNRISRRFWAAVLGTFAMACLAYVPSLGQTQQGKSLQNKSGDPSQLPQQGQPNPRPRDKGPMIKDKGTTGKQGSPGQPKSGGTAPSTPTPVPSSQPRFQPQRSIVGGYLGNFGGNTTNAAPPSFTSGGLQTLFGFQGTGINNGFGFSGFGFNNGFGFSGFGFNNGFGFGGFGFNNNFGFNGVGFYNPGQGNSIFNSPGFRTIVFNLTHSANFQGMGDNWYSGFGFGGMGFTGFNGFGLYGFNPGMGFNGFGLYGFNPGMGFNGFGFNGIALNSGLGLGGFGLNGMGFNPFNPGFGVGGGILGGFGFQGF